MSTEVEDVCSIFEDVAAEVDKECLREDVCDKECIFKQKLTRNVYVKMYVVYSSRG